MSDERRTGPARMAKELLGDFVRRRPWMSASYVGLLVLQTVLSGVSLLLLLPMLAVVGVGGEEGTIGEPIAEFVFDTLGLPESLVALLVAFVALVALREGVGFLAAEVGARLRLGYTMNLRLRLFSGISRASWPFVASLRTSDAQFALQTEVGQVSSAVMELLRSVQMVLNLVVLVILTVIIAPALAIPVLVVAAVVAALSGPLARRSSSYGRIALRAGRGAGATAYDNLEGIREAKSFGAEARAIRRYEGELEEGVRGELLFRRGQAAVSALLGLGAAVALAILAYAAVEGVTGNALTPAALILVIFLVSRIIPASIALTQLIQRLAHTTPAYDSVTALVAAADDAREMPPGVDDAVLRLDDLLVVDGVRFRYDPGGPFVLDGVTAEVPAGSLVLVTGPTGSGKTTLADVVLGLVEPEEGNVTIDGSVLTPETLSSWRRATAYVPQHTFLFEGTIADNLRLAEPEASDDELWAALAAAQIDGRIREMPGGLAGTIGDDGHGLSGGERQRLSLARSLLREPSLLVLDEATSALDAETERRILQTVSGLGPSTTVLAITHRESASVYASSVVHVDGGVVTVSPPASNLP